MSMDSLSIAITNAKDCDDTMWVDCYSHRLGYNSPVSSNVVVDMSYL